MNQNKLLIQFKSIYFNNKLETPIFDDHSSLQILKKKAQKKVSFIRAYHGWRIGGSKDEMNLGSGKSFLRWMNHHQLSILWDEGDFIINPLFGGASMPKHTADDEFAKDHSFAIKTVIVEGRSIKLYITDQHMIRLFNFHHGNPEDFLELVKVYISHRIVWEKWKIPSPFFLDWMISHQKRPIFQPGQVGLSLGV